MRSKLLIAFVLAVLFACSDDNNNPTYPFERTVLDVSIVKKCKDGSSPPGSNCYLMRWSHPIEKKDLHSYYVWLDTTVVPNGAQGVTEAQISLASAVKAYSGRGDGDSLDLTNLISNYLKRDSLHIAIWARYSGSEQGVVQHLHAHFGDDIRPSVVNFGDSVSANTIWIDWMRPTDQRDFYSPGEINGPIAGYNVSIKAETNATEDIRNARVFLTQNPVNSSLMRFERFSKDGKGVKLASVTQNDPKLLRLAVIDGKGFDSTNTLLNSWRMEITDLKPEHSYNIIIAAYDSAGNVSREESRSIRTTDNIPPNNISSFWYYTDSNDNRPILDSNRLILFWTLSMDPLGNGHYRNVMGYSIEQQNANAQWNAIPRTYAIGSEYYNARYRLENGSMKLDPEGGYVSDTLRWVLPEETVALRVRAIDSSRHYSGWTYTTVAPKGELWEHKCPNQDFAPVQMSSGVFCMEKLQHKRNSNEFKNNVLYREAKKTCEDNGFRLCSEQEWHAACNSKGFSYGVIEERSESGIFSPSEFLFLYCGVGTGDSSSAIKVDKRNKICASPDGIRDLPGQLQEWVTGLEGTKEVPLLKGTSYAVFEGASRVELAQCRNRFKPTRIRPRFTEDSIYLYRTGSRIDTMLTRDSLRTLYAAVAKDKFTDTILVYALSKNGDSLGLDYVDQAECRRRGEKKDGCLYRCGDKHDDVCGDKWFGVLWEGLNYKLEEKRRVLILGTESREVLVLGTDSTNVANIFLDPTVGFRCCANAN